MKTKIVLFSALMISISLASAMEIKEMEIEFQTIIGDFLLPFEKAEGNTVTLSDEVKDKCHKEDGCSLITIKSMLKIDKHIMDLEKENQKLKNHANGYYES
jgi:hypothetical protein